MIKKILVTLAKLLLCGGAFYSGIILGGGLWGAAGLPMPDMPAGSNPAAIQTAMMFSSLLAAACLAFLSARLAVNFILRWLSLAALVGLAYGVNNYLEARIFTTYSAASPVTVLMAVMSGLAGGAAAAWLFPSRAKPEPLRVASAPFFRKFGGAGWAWRVLAAVAAFPVIYYLFGMLISPIVLPYYQQAGSGLTIPGLGTLLPVLFLRSFFFLAASFMIVAAWGKTRLSLALGLGLTMFMLVGGIGLLVASFLPGVLRVVHSFEILADSLCYVTALVLLFRPGAPAAHTRTEPIAAGE